MKFFLIVALSAFIFTACTQSDQNNEISEPSIESLNSLLSTPRDSLSLEQKETVLNLLKIMDEKLVVEDGSFAFKATEDDFKAKGINLYYFEMLKKDVYDMNTSIKNDDLNLDLEEILIESKKKLKIVIEDFSR